MEGVAVCGGTSGTLEIMARAFSERSGCRFVVENATKPECSGEDASASVHLQADV